MSTEDLDVDLLTAFKERFGLNKLSSKASLDTGVLKGAQHVYNNAIDVFIERVGTQSAAHFVQTSMEARGYSIESWTTHELHPRVEEFGEDITISFIFTMDLLNFSFWSSATNVNDEFCVEYAGRRWKGYWSLVAALRRAIDEGIPILSSDFWQCEEDCNLELLQHVFRSQTKGAMPLLEERLECLREAGNVLYREFQCSFRKCIEEADGSAVKLVNMLAKHFTCFRDEVEWEYEKVRFMKRAQILVADLWACFRGRGPGHFRDIDAITAFADYRMPQMLHSLGCISYSPPLENRIRTKGNIDAGNNWEVQLRGCSIWAIELIKREMLRNEPKSQVNSILIDYFLYDLCKEQEHSDTLNAEKIIPHHRTRSIYY